MKVFPRWKYGLLLFTLLLGVVYAIPNLYGEDPVLQVTGLGTQAHSINTSMVDKLQDDLRDADLAPKSAFLQENGVLVLRFSHPDTQLKAKALLEQVLGDRFSVGLNLASLTPSWLIALGAKPMKLGLDLRGGVHFLMEVDVQSVIHRRLEQETLQLPRRFSAAQLSYQALHREKDTIHLRFKEQMARDRAYDYLKKEDQDWTFSHDELDGIYGLNLSLSSVALQTMRRETLEQSLATLRKRVNELGVAEAVVQRQGINQIVVELPGIQDTSYARQILGKTATLAFLMEDEEHSLADVLSGQLFIGSKVFVDRAQRSVLLKTQPILSGSAITGASAGQDRDGRPAVNIRLSGDISLFSKATRDNVGKRMGVVYREVQEHQVHESVISLATIHSPLGHSFQITGLSFEESRDLALLLRSGALPAPVSMVEESIVGPSMGQENIRMGLFSVSVGLLAVLVFMGLYYSLFGLIADLALLVNLVLLVALMSLIGATLSLPGIAGIVLTLGMAVDANVLIFERIREEMRAGLSPKASIHRGFECAFATILDSNVTTLIVGLILFSIGTGPVKGFATTLCIGIVTSLFTAVTGSRAVIELLQRGKKQCLRVGI
jgi:preprotein translocase subunit SecD